MAVCAVCQFLWIRFRGVEEIERRGLGGMGWEGLGRDGNGIFG